MCAVWPLAAQAPDIIYYNGKIVTEWKTQPVAQAVAIRAGKFAAVGGNAAIRKTAGPRTKLVDLHGRCVLPGLNDSHTHPIMAALAEQQGRCRSCIPSATFRRTCENWPPPLRPTS